MRSIVGASRGFDAPENDLDAPGSGLRGVKQVQHFHRVGTGYVGTVVKAWKRVRKRGFVAIDCLGCDSR